MSITVTCKCGRVMKVPDSYAGKKGRCPRCEAVIEIPLAGEVEIDDSELLLDDSGPPSEVRVSEAAQLVDATGRICPRCKSKVPGAEDFCPKCGANYVMASRQLERKQSDDEARKKAGKKREHGSPLVKIGALAGIVVVLAVVLIFVFTRKSEESDLPGLGRKTGTGQEQAGRKTSTSSSTSVPTRTSAKTSTAISTAQAASRLEQEVEELLDQLSTADAEGRTKAIELLVKKGMPAVRLIVKGLENESVSVRTGALDAVYGILGEKASSYVIKLLSDTDLSVRRYAAEMAKKLPRHEQLLLGLIMDEDAALAGEVALYLVLKNYSAASNRISRVLEQKGPDNVSPRMAVAALTCGFTNGTAGSILALESDEQVLREAAIAALEKIYGTNRGFDASAAPDLRKNGLEAWKSWWEKRTTFSARMTALVARVQDEEKLRRSARQNLDEYRLTFWRLLVERWRIIEMGGDAVPGLAATLDRKVFRGSDRLRAEEALHLLAVIGEAAVIPISLVARNSNHPKRTLAVRSLGRLGESGARALLKIAEEKPKGLDISDILVALGRTGSKSAVPVLEAALESSDARTRFTAFSALVRMGKTGHALKYLPEMNDLQRPEFRELLIRCASPELAQALIDRINAGTQPLYAKPALTLLGEIGGSAAGKHLERLLKKDGEGMPLAAVIEAAARLNDAKLASTALDAAEQLEPERKEKAYFALLHFEDDAAFNRIYQLAARGDRYASELLPELALRGYSKARTTARTVASKGSGMAQIAGIRALGNTGDRIAAKKLWNNYITLKDPMGGLTDAMIELVGMVKFTDAIPFLAENLKKGRRVRLSLHALGRMGDAAAEKILLDHMANSRRSSLEALALNPSKRLVAVFGESLMDQTAPLDERLIAARALGKTGAKEAVRELRTALADPKPEIRAAAAAGLGLLGDRSVVNYLVTLALDDDEEVRREVMLSLALLGNYIYISELIGVLEYINLSSTGDRDFRDRAIEALAASENKAGVSFRLSEYTTARSRLGALLKLRAHFESRGKSLPRDRKYSAKAPVSEGFAVRRELGEISKDFSKVLKKLAPRGIKELGPEKPLEVKWESRKLELPHSVYGRPAAGEGYVAAYLEIPPVKPAKPPLIKPKEEPKPTYELVVFSLKEDTHYTVSPVLEKPKSSLCIHEGGLVYFHKTAPDHFDRAAEITVCEGELRKYDLAGHKDAKIWEAPLVEEPVSGPAVSKNFCVIATPRAIRVLDIKKQEETALVDRVEEDVFKLGSFNIHGQIVWWERHYLNRKPQSWYMNLVKLEKKELDLVFLPEFTGSRAVNILDKRVEIWDYSRGSINAVYARTGSHALDGRFCYFTAGRTLYVLDTESMATARVSDNVDSVAGVTAQGVVVVRDGNIFLLSPK